MFRFHTGSIKSRPFETQSESSSSEFRFHTGSIKRKMEILNAHGDFGFDSILVRLKVSFFFMHAFPRKVFRFHTGSIKREKSNVAVSIRYWFAELGWMHRSSSKVFRFHTGSIKSILPLNADHFLIRGFDSILVRLKFPRFHAGDFPLFRFHTGSIKRSHIQISFLPLRLFRFHTGSIKSVTEIFTLSFPTTFRFHTGSIKRIVYTL